MYRWLTRIRDLDRAVSEATPPRDVARVQIVDNGWYRGSRERAPYARHWSTIGAPAAGHQNGFYISGIDRANMNCRVLVEQFTCSATCQVWIANPQLLTLTADNPVTPVAIDDDPDVTPVIHEIDIATANLPAATSGIVDQFPGNGATANVGALPMIAHFDTGASTSTTPVMAFLVVNATAAAVFRYTVQWQAMRRG